MRSLAMTYFHMGKPHTIIGAEQFHYRVRDGIGWFPLAMAARRKGVDALGGSRLLHGVRECLGVIWSSLTGN